MIGEESIHRIIRLRDKRDAKPIGSSGFPTGSIAANAEIVGCADDTLAEVICQIAIPPSRATISGFERIGDPIRQLTAAAAFSSGGKRWPPALKESERHFFRFLAGSPLR